jgi:hypothetical protein
MEREEVRVIPAARRIRDKMTSRQQQEEEVVSK